MKVGYARVSSDDQNLARQIEILQQNKVEKIYEEKESGKDIVHRPVWNELVEFVRDGDMLVVASLDRLSRNYDDIRSIVEELKRKHVELVVDDLPQTHSGNELVDKFMLDMMINLMSFVAENERAKIKERQRQGIAEAKKAHVYTGRRREYSPTGKKSFIYNSVVERLNKGRTLRQIAREIKINPNQVYRIKKMAKEDGTLTIDDGHTGGKQNN